MSYTPTSVLGLQDPTRQNLSQVLTYPCRGLSCSIYCNSTWSIYIGILYMVVWCWTREHRSNAASTHTYVGSAYQLTRAILTPSGCRVAGSLGCRSVQCRPYKYSSGPLNILFTANEDDPRRHLPHLVLNRQGTINKYLLELGARRFFFL